MRPKILVLTTVHPADDPRVRERHVGVLAEHTPVRYATRPPRPSRTDDHEWVGLPGTRPVRWWRGLRAALRPEAGVISLHDPELIPLGLLVRWLRRVPVVFDCHEHVPDQVLVKDWVPGWARAPLRSLVAGMLRLAERHLVITLAEAGYAELFQRSHPVFANYPLPGRLPDPAPDGRYVVFVGDITEVRGGLEAVRMVAGMSEPLPLRMVGRCREPFRSRLLALADALGVEVELLGFLPHHEAMRIAAGATVGVCPWRDAPNYRHSLPTKVVEYLAVGIPLVASDLPGIRAVVAGLPGVQLVPAGDVAAASVALDRAAGEDMLRKAAAAHVAEVRRRFAWPAGEVWHLYEGLLREAGSARPLGYAFRR